MDLRNHGDSAEVEDLHPPHDLANAAADVANLFKAQGWPWPDVVLGHSLGGKVALQFAQDIVNGRYGESAALPKQVWTLDSVPGVVSPGDSSFEVEKVLEVLQNLPSQIPSRKWLVDHMLKLGFSVTLSNWLGSNLNTTGRKTWAFNLEGAVQMFNSYRETEYWSLLESPPDGIEFQIVRAEKSDRWEPDVIQRLASLATRHLGPLDGKVSVHVLPNAGHWVHVDNPEGLRGIVAPKMASLP